jgi:hypothetical protein
VRYVRACIVLCTLHTWLNPLRLSLFVRLAAGAGVLSACIGFVTLQGWCVHFCTCKSVGARTAAEMLCLSDGWGVVTWLNVCGTTNNSIMSCVGHQILFHHHHQITKLSHSINAIGPAPHRSGHQILFVTV